ncbi:hypothetical protein JTB14_027128 [Gonioctena quinquepunctata]|nr:hypothetical protein JTB14_027128 [Gonioctena quinquepunctata]
MFWQPLTQSEFERLAENFGDSEEGELNTEFVEEDDDHSDATSEHSDHGTEIELGASVPSRTRQHNIIHLPGTRGPMLQNKPSTPLEAWTLLVTENILDLIVDHTNQKTTDLCLKYGNTATFVDHINKTEVEAFLGVVFSNLTVKMLRVFLLLIALGVTCTGLR